MFLIQHNSCPFEPNLTRIVGRGRGRGRGLSQGRGQRLAFGSASSSITQSAETLQAKRANFEGHGVCVLGNGLIVENVSVK